MKYANKDQRLTREEVRLDTSLDYTRGSLILWFWNTNIKLDFVRCIYEKYIPMSGGDK